MKGDVDSTRDCLHDHIDGAPTEPLPPPRDKRQRSHETVDSASAYFLKWHGDSDGTPLQEWLVDGMLPKVGKAIVAGQWGTYKTFVVFDLCRAVMTKTTFAGRAVSRQGGVLFIAMEGQNEIRLRLEGVAREKVATLGDMGDAIAVDPTHMPFAWTESCPRLTADDAVKNLGAIVANAGEQMRERFGLPLALIVIDTLMPAARFKDADDTAENQRVMSALTSVAVAAGALVLAVDHFGKDVTTETRNSSVKEAAADAVLALLADRTTAGNVRNSRLAIRKVRGAPTGQEIPFRMRTVTISENAGHDPITTLIVEWESQATEKAVAPRAKKKRWPQSLVIFKDALNVALADAGERLAPFLDGPEGPAVKRDSVRAEFMKRYPADKPKTKEKAFARAEQRALTNKLIAAREIGPVESAATFVWALAKGAEETNGHVAATATGPLGPMSRMSPVANADSRRQ
jgi:hypothetical protein